MRPAASEFANLVSEFPKWKLPNVAALAVADGAEQEQPSIGEERNRITAD
jgi:hypothetical protein